MKTAFYKTENAINNEHHYDLSKRKHSISKCLAWIPWGLVYIPYVVIRDAVWFIVLSYKDNYNENVYIAG